MNVVETRIRTYVREMDLPPRYIGGETALHSNLLKAYNATSLMLESQGIEMQSYSTIQKTMTPECQVWSKTYHTETAEIWVCLARLEVK